MMLTLSKDTWHYRNFEIWQERSISIRHRDLRKGERQPDLCTYTRIVLFWSLFYRLGRWWDRNEWAQYLVGGILAYGFAIIMSQGLYAWLLRNVWPWWSVFLLPFIWVPIIGGLGIGALFLYDQWGKKRREKKYGEPREKQPNVVVEFVKAKKKKICPMIEFQEEGK